MSRVLTWIRGPLIFGLAWVLIFLLGRVLHLGTGWPLWTVALIAAVAVEIILRLYRYEQGAVGRRKGGWLTALRLTALVALVWMLLQPVFSRKVNRELEQEIVVVLDESASMNLIDPGETSTRYDIAADAINASGLFEELEGKGGVRLMRAARKALGKRPVRPWCSWWLTMARKQWFAVGARRMLRRCAPSSPTTRCASASSASTSASTGRRPSAPPTRARRR